MSLRLKRKFVGRRAVALQEGQEAPWFCKLYVLWNGISFAPVDLFKGIIFGLVSKLVCDGLDVSIKDATDGFLKGFVLSGIMGGLEDFVDSITGTALNFPQGGIPPGTESIIHEIFQSILLQGIIGGAVVAGIRALMK